MAAILQIKTKHYGSTKEWPILQDWGNKGWGARSFQKNPCTESRILLAKAQACHMALASSGDSDTRLPCLILQTTDRNNIQGLLGVPKVEGAGRLLLWQEQGQGMSLCQARVMKNRRVKNEEEEEAMKGKWKCTGETPPQFWKFQVP